MKKELIKRDHLYHKFEETIEDWGDREKNIDYTRRISKLYDEIKKKWLVEVSFNGFTQEIHITRTLNNDAIIWVGSPITAKEYKLLNDGYVLLPQPPDPLKLLEEKPISFPVYSLPEWAPMAEARYKDYSSRVYPAIKWQPYPNPFKKRPVLTDINKFVADGWMPILIDVSRITRDSLKIFKKIISDLINDRKKEEKIKSPFFYKGIARSRIPEHSELTFLYSLRKESTFQKYLKWYDYHMGEDYNTPKGFTFRKIAIMNLHDLIKRKCPDKVKMFDDQIRVIKNIPKDLKKQIQKYTNESIEWEDAVEKGVKLIYRAIHRKLYPSKIKAELFNCPIHGELCPEDCENLKKSMEIFDNRYKLRPLYTSDDIDKHDGKIRAKSLSNKVKAEKIKHESELKKYQKKPIKSNVPLKF